MPLLHIASPIATNSSSVRHLTSTLMSCAEESALGTCGSDDPEPQAAEQVPALIVIIIIIVGAEPARLRVHGNLVGLSVFRSSGFDVAAVTRDPHVRPSLGLQFLLDLLL